MCGGGHSNGAGDARTREERRQADLEAQRARVNDAFTQFDDKFYKDRAKSFLDYEQPQFDDQFANARKNIVFALSRSGNLNSSVAADQFANLGREYAANSTKLQAGAADYANQTRQQVEQNRADAQQQLSSAEGADAEATNAQVRARLATLPTSPPPLSQLFTNLSGVFANRAIANSQGYAPSAGGGFGARLFSGSPSYTVN